MAATRAPPWGDELDLGRSGSEQETAGRPRGAAAGGALWSRPEGSVPPRAPEGAASRDGRAGNERKPRAKKKIRSKSRTEGRLRRPVALKELHRETGEEPGGERVAAEGVGWEKNVTGSGGCAATERAAPRERRGSSAGSRPLRVTERAAARDGRGAARIEPSSCAKSGDPAGPRRGRAAAAAGAGEAASSGGDERGVPVSSAQPSGTGGFRGLFPSAPLSPRAPGGSGACSRQLRSALGHRGVPGLVPVSSAQPSGTALGPRALFQPGRPHGRGPAAPAAAASAPPSPESPENRSHALKNLSVRSQGRRAGILMKSPPLSPSWARLGISAAPGAVSRHRLLPQGTGLPRLGIKRDRFGEEGQPQKPSGSPREPGAARGPQRMPWTQRWPQQRLCPPARGCVPDPTVQPEVWGRQRSCWTEDGWRSRSGRKRGDKGGGAGGRGGTEEEGRGASTCIHRSLCPQLSASLPPSRR
ncbi:collagen alpha-1(I) chain-like [Corvus kubaryi]|uniref:collagen alpha-1(I) chain-like n=1 Tax=Corvus kubaryi TaxID=68294 RepID=UPI001C03F5AE|nr:collagen alpha-1(I) chain-like [Corvus kubaryi]